MDTALEALVAVEQQCGLRWRARPRTMTVLGWEAFAAGAERRAEVARLPRDERHDARGEPERVVLTTSAATVVRLGKFSASTVVRGRAFYLDHDPALAVKFVVGGAPRREFEAEIAARGVLAASGHLPAPRIVGSGVAPELSYLTETVVWGRHAHDHALKQRLALDLVTGLLRAHRAAGVVDENFQLHKDTRRRLTKLTKASWVPPVLPAARFMDQVDRLIGDDALLPVGWCHGDLGFSNVIVDDTGAANVIDWEHAGRMPVAVDLAKLATMSPDQRGVADHIINSARPEDIGAAPGRRSGPDQLALMIVRELSWWQSRRRAALAAGRIAAFERGVRRRLRLFDALCPDPVAERRPGSRGVRP